MRSISVSAFLTFVALLSPVSAAELEIAQLDVQEAKQLYKPNDAQERLKQDLSGHQKTIDARGAGLKPDAAPFKKWGGVSPDGRRLSANNYYFELDGKPFPVVAGEFHPQRYPVEYWEEAILAMKAAGLNAISSYVFWSQFESTPGVFDFTGANDIRAFAALCARHGMYVMLRAGPFCNSEFLLGGMPAWLYGKPLVERSDDPLYLELVGRYYAALGGHLKGMFWGQGGPIVSTQVENELATAPDAWERIFTDDVLGPGYTGPRGEGFLRHYKKLKELALKGGLASPFFTCTGWTLAGPLPIDEMYPTDGGYMNLSPPKNENHWLTTFGSALTEFRGKVPRGFSEIGVGSPMRFSYRPIIPPQSVYCSALTRLGGTEALMLGYYMFHGGTNPMDKTYGFTNKNATLPARTYDFAAPIGEFGDWRESLFWLRPLNLFTVSFASELANTEVRQPEKGAVPAKENRLRYVARMAGDSGFLFFANYGNVTPLPPATATRFEVSTDTGTVPLPRVGTLDIPTAGFGILPINLQLGQSARLVSATAQPVVRFDRDGDAWYVFSQVCGLPCEFVFAKDTIVESKAPEVAPVGSAPESDGAQVFRVAPGHKEAFRLKRGDGRSIHIVVLPEEEARQLAVFDIGGHTTLALSAQQVTCDGRSIILTRRGDNHMAVSLFPPLPAMPKIAGVDARSEADGIFQRWSLTVPSREIHAAVTDFSAGKRVLKIAKDQFDGLNDIHLRVKMKGKAVRVFDIASGLLVADHLDNKTPWLVGLKRFRASLAKEGLWLRAEPEAAARADNHDTNGMVLLDKSKPGQPTVAATFESLEFLPEYRVELPCGSR